MPNNIVWFDSSETGAPTLNNVAGSLDSVLNACLVSGFNTVALDSVVVASGVATATRSAGHGFADKRIVELAGAGTSAINGRKLITRTGAATFTFPAPGVTDGAIGGTITAKRSPLGWARPLSSGNVSIYTRTDPAATAMALRVDDSGAGVAASTYARVRMLETYADLNTYTNPAPPASVLSGGGAFAPKGADNTDAKKWALVGDGRTLYLFTEQSNYPASSYGGLPGGILMFGDLARLNSGDAYACLLAGASAGGGFTPNDLGAIATLGQLPSSDAVWLCRPSSGIGSAVAGGMAGTAGGGGTRRLGGLGPKYPSPVDNGFVAQQPLLVAENNSTFGNPLRGVLRGVADPLAQLISTSADAPGWYLTVLDNLVGTDRRYLAVAFQQQGSYGVALFDITGDWA